MEDPSVLGRRRLLALGGAFAGSALAGCVGSAPSADAREGLPDGGGGSPTESETAGEAGAPPTTDRIAPLAYSLDDLLGNVRSGGVAKDGIPSIDDPKPVPAGDADFLEGGDVVFGTVVNGEARAYPQEVLVWHEIANDVLGGENVSVTYCPLTGTALGFDRGDTTFGVSGRLLNSNLVMYDRATDTWWPQVLATGIRGDLKGRSLRTFPVYWTRWGPWKRAYPDTTVLSTDTGYAKNYRRDPYGNYSPKRGYYQQDRLLFALMSQDDRLRLKASVVGVHTDSAAAAVSETALRDERVLTVETEAKSFLFVWLPDVETGVGYRAPEDGTVKPAGGDGSQYRAPDGETYAADDLPLDALRSFHAMWFAWAAFFPETALHA